MAGERIPGLSYDEYIHGGILSIAGSRGGSWPSCGASGQFRDGDELCRAVLVPTAAFTFFGVIDGLAGQFYLLPWRTFTTPIGIYAFMYFVIEILRQQLRAERELSLCARPALEYEAVLAAPAFNTGCTDRLLEPE
jgi:hypothetical protein